MRVAIVAESFLPNVNGVTNSVLRVLEHLHAHGHEAMVIAPGARPGQEEIPDYLGFPIERVPTIKVPLINSLPIGVPRPTVTKIIHDFQPDIVHLASPFVLAAAGAFSARTLDIPCIGVYQTDVAGFANNYRLSLLSNAAWGWTRHIHNICHRTLAPSTETIESLESHGVKNVYRWGRGVDAVRFHPSKRSEALRNLWNPTGKKKIVGFVGRLAAEKSVDRLASLSGRDDIQLVIVGDGPERDALAHLMPDAVFTGALHGEELARAYASLDVFVHAGQYETFCQAIQEALASGVPSIGPLAGGPRDLIRPGVDGDLLEVATFKDDLPAAVERIIDPENYPKMVEAARESIRTKTWEAVCGQLMGHYEEVMEIAKPGWRAELLRPFARSAA